MAAGHDFETSFEIRKIGRWFNLAFPSMLFHRLFASPSFTFDMICAAIAKIITFPTTPCDRKNEWLDEQEFFISWCVQGKLRHASCRTWTPNFVLMKTNMMEICAVCHFRCDSEHFAGTEGKFGEDEGLLGRRLLPRSKHPLQRTQESHRLLWKTLQTEGSCVVSSYHCFLHVNTDFSSSFDDLPLFTRFIELMCVLQVCGFYHGDVHPVP